MQKLLEQAFSEHVAPSLAASIGVLHPKKPQNHMFYTGTLHDSSAAQTTTAATIYDLASLTKILATTLLCAQAIIDAKLTLEEQPFEVWPQIKVRHLLQHTSGLPSWIPAYEASINATNTGTLQGKNSVLEAIFETEPTQATEQQTVYSDLGFIALATLLEQRYQVKFEELYLQFLTHYKIQAAPFYIPIYAQGYHLNISQCAPTEFCPWRGRAMQAQVHDDNAYAMGGVAGHAGLFANLNQVTSISTWILKLLAYRTSAQNTFLQGLQYSASEQELALVLQKFANISGERGLGFDRQSDGGSTSGVFSTRAVGHLGFTGTSIWLDPKHPAGPAYFILLTNRVYPSRSNTAIKVFRQKFHKKADNFLRSNIPTKVSDETI